MNIDREQAGQPKNSIPALRWCQKPVMIKVYGFQPREISTIQVIFGVSVFSIVFGFILINVASVEPPYPAWVEVNEEQYDVGLRIISEEDLSGHPIILSKIQTYKYLESIPESLYANNITKTDSSPTPLIKIPHDEGVNLLALFEKKYVRSTQHYSFAFTVNNSSYSINIWIMKNPPGRL